MITFTVKSLSTHVEGPELYYQKLDDVLAVLKTELRNAINQGTLDDELSLSIRVIQEPYLENGLAWEHRTRVEIERLRK